MGRGGMIVLGNGHDFVQTLLRTTIKIYGFFFVASGFAPEFSWHLPSSAGCFLQVSSREEGKAP